MALEEIVARTPPEVRQRLASLVNGLAERLHPVDPRDTILLASSPRSGSTWVMNLLEAIPGYRSIFEPLHPVWFRDPRELGLGLRPTVRDLRERAELRGYVGEVLAGRVRGGYPGHRWSASRFHRVLRADKLLVKSVRLTRALPAIVESFPLRRAVHLVRHPCATVASQLRTGIRGYRIPSDEPVPPSFVLAEVDRADADVDQAALADLLEDGPSTQAACLAVLWSLDNLPLLHADAGETWTVVRYEDLVLDPTVTMGELFGSLGEPVPPEAWDQLDRRSQTSRSDAIGDPEAYLLGWRGTLGEQEVEAVAHVLQLFDIQTYGTTPRELADVATRTGQGTP